MEQVFEVTIRTGDEEGAELATVDEVGSAVKDGLAEIGYDDVDVTVAPL